MINIMGYFINKIEKLLMEIWTELKGGMYLFIFITLLMIGIITRSVLLTVVSAALIIAAMGAIESDRGVKDTTYIIKGKRVLAKKFLKVKPEKEGWWLGWGLVSLLIMLILGIAVLAFASIPILIIAVIIRIFVNSWIMSIIASISLFVLGGVAIYFKLR